MQKEIRGLMKSPQYILKNIFLFFMIHILSPSLMKRRIDYIINSRINEYVIRNINGYKMLLSLKDKGICSQLMLYGKRETLSTEYLMNSGLIKNGDVVLDIGANIGYYALLESILVGNSGKVYAVEPVSTNIKILKTNINLNKFENIEVFKLAMGDKNGLSKINVSEKSNLSSINKIPFMTYIKEEEVEMLTVDSFLKTKICPSLIRMDVEGFEYNIIKGMKNTLNKDVKIMVELHGHPLMTRNQMYELFEILKNHNFKVKFSVIDYVQNINKFVNCLINKMQIWKVPVILNMDIETLQDSLVNKKIESAHVIFYKSG